MPTPAAAPSRSDAPDDTSEDGASAPLRPPARPENGLAHGVTDRQAWLALLALMVGFFMLLVDATIVTVSIPAIMTAFKADVAGVMWVTSAYLLTYAVPLLIMGRLGDRYGPRTIYLIGLALFTGASLWCGFAHSLGALIAARGVQGLGAAMMSPQSMAVITRLFPPQRRGAAMGLWGATAGIATLVGPILGGLLTDSWGWPWIFWVNVPIGIIGLIAVWVLVPRLPRSAHSFDWLGVILNGLAVFAIVFALQEGGTLGWDWRVWAMIGAGLVLLAIFVWTQARGASREPLLPLGLFNVWNFSVANVAVFIMGVLTTSMMFPVMLYVQGARGLTPTQAALLTAPSAVLSLVMAPFIGKLTDRLGAKPFLIAGFLAMLASMGTYALFIKPGVSVLWLLVSSALTGLAGSLLWGPLSVCATRGLEVRWAGAGSGVYNATRQLGSVLGSAAIAAIIEWQLSSRMPKAPAGAPQGPAGSGHRLPEFLQQPYTTAMATAMWLPLAASLVGLATVLLIRQHARAGAAEAAPRSAAA